MNSLDRTLELFAHEEPAPEVVHDAQRKLENLIAASAPRKQTTRAGGWLAAAASAAAVVLAAILLPLTPTTALAFSDVQQHFRDFGSLRFDVEQRMADKLLMKARVSVLANGSVRTEVGDDVVVVVNSQDKRMLTLLKKGKLAVVSPLPEPGTKEDAMAWLKEVRDFQGQAVALPDSREIQGQRAHGWELDVAQGKITLWANDAGLPLAMRVDQGMALDLNFHFEFEPDLPAETFSTEVPAGYTRGEQED
jgi:outer membrane lipoprotein-sorting protein